ncbi:DUF1987 domain-containing protein [Paracrocinitomix mangrovi]|uniref:DUF1987 domain-containing protein n=1 Tax=Paracrocinitomix mangrovi TaxID=2862509 RepID=UPI001C8E7963|nr:DUF1987 domain-containing protein [Paracrocinitomix mangrovi]UKN00729.1 DUF1987 domain-containing protein [Paracrocinitomix mangrovi]
MEIYMKKATNSTPKILGNVTEGTLAISGRCYPEDSQSFFASLNSWLEHFYQTENPVIHVLFDLEYMNTSAGTVMAQMLKRLTILSDDKKIKVEWRYDNEDLDMKDMGESFNLLYGEMVTLIPKTI